MTENKRHQWYKSKWMIILLVPIVFFFMFLLFHALFPIKVAISYSQTVTDRNGELLHAFLSKDDKWRMYTELSEISPELKKAIVYKEDKYFYYHLGVNPIAVFRAFWNNVVQNKRTSGASTITMQVARLLSPKPRTYLNKFVEMFRALQLEWMYSKDEILQLYLNLVPYGGNIEGVKSASVLYFEKMPNHLSLAEITALSIIPNRPNSLIIGTHNDTIVHERNIWLNRMLVDDLFEEQQIKDAMAEELVAFRHLAPKNAPHLSYRLKMTHPNTNNIQSTIDNGLQIKATEIVTSYSRTLRANEIHNAAVMIFDNHTKEVVAYVGSADFFDDEDGGQVDGIRAIRQPGSTLKPLVYGLAFDMGLSTPLEVVTDVPVNFNGYAPVNFNKEYNGYVTIEYALAQSLNIPAVKTLEKIGVPAAIDKLVAAQFKTIEKQSSLLGLSLVLGGCGVSLEELTGLYAAFADSGMFTPPKYLMNEKSSAPKQVLSLESSYMISEILTQLERPDLPNYWRNATNLPSIAWKTGTSYGRRDGWSIGYNNDYTIGVWVGNFAGNGVPELTGASKATPLLFQLFQAIESEHNKNWLTAPESLPFRLVCADSGLPPSEQCNNKVFDYYLPLISSTEECQHLKHVWLAENDSFVYCMHCLPAAGYKEAFLPNHPNEMLAFFNYYGIGYTAIPPHNPSCAHYLVAGNPPKIVTPSDGSTYYVNSGEVEEMVFQAQAASDAQTIYWYVDDVFYAESEKNKPVLWYPLPGKHKISCSDDIGHNSDINIDVQFIAF